MDEKSLEEETTKSIKCITESVQLIMTETPNNWDDFDFTNHKLKLKLIIL